MQPTTVEAPTTSAPTAPSTPQSYVQSLIGPADGLDLNERMTEEKQQPTQTAATAPETDTGQTETTVTETGTEQPPGEEAGASKNAAALADLIQQFANETGLNPDDPGQRKTLNRLANKELFIRKLQADLDAQKKQPEPAKPADEPELMTAFEKELAAEQPDAAAPGEPPPTGTEPDAAAAKPAETAKGYGDIGDTWKTAEESLAALNEAWAANDLRKAHDIEVARLRRNFDQAVAPQLLAFIDKMVNARLQEFSKKEFGDVLPVVRKSVGEQRMAESREFAVNELRKAGAADIDKMFAKEDGPPLHFDGKEWVNSPLNRVLVKHPEILSIVKTHEDPIKAERATFLARYKLAYQLYKQATPAVSAEAAKQLVDAGRNVERNKDSDRARQTLNAGSGATGLMEKGSKGSYVNDLNNLPGEVPFSSLFSAG